MKRQTILVGVILSFFVAATLLGENETKQSNQSDGDQGEYPEDAGSRDLFKSLKLDTICPNPDLTPPEVDSLNAYQSHSAITIRWKPVNDPAVLRYLAVASVDCTFTDLIYFYRETETRFDSITTIPVSVEDTVWCRVYSRDVEGCISPPSNTVSTIIDMSGPKINRFVLEDLITGDTLGTHERIVNVRFKGADLSGCRYIYLSEDTAFSNNFKKYSIVDSIECCDSGIETFELSPNQEKKTLYGRMTDILGNVGDIASYSMFFARKLYNYPNPFIPSQHSRTNIVYWLSKPCNVVYIDIYDSFGSHVCRISGGGNEGFNTVTWDGHNSNGDLVGNGGYLCVLKGDKKYTHKIAVLK